LALPLAIDHAGADRRRDTDAATGGWIAGQHRMGRAAVLRIRGNEEAAQAHGMRLEFS
jgi:hypothetical protein